MMTIAPDVSDFDYSDYYPDQPIIDQAETSRTFNSSGLDTLVFVHIQKTGGSTLERRFVENIGNSNNLSKYYRGFLLSCTCPFFVSNDLETVYLL